MDGSLKPAIHSNCLCLLPSELLESIVFRLSLPDLLRVRAVCKTLNSAFSSPEFRRDFNHRLRSCENWLYVYMKQSLRNSILYGFSDLCRRWFKMPVSDCLFPAVPPAEDLYFLTASGGIFLFALNNSRELLVVNLTSGVARKIPVSPLGPRGTSSWRRSGMKLVSGEPGSESFKFLFAELCGDRPVLFIYSSDSDKWRVTEARESETNTCLVSKESVFLSVVHGRSQSVVVCACPENDTAVVFRPRFAGAVEGLAVGPIGDYTTNTLHIYGDGKMVAVKSEALHSNECRVFKEIELWGLGYDGRTWEILARVPSGLIENVKKPYSVMMGCLEERLGFVRVVLVSNFRGILDFIWLCYDLDKRDWTWVPLGDCYGMKGLNMAGLAISSAPPLGSHCT